LLFSLARARLYVAVAAWKDTLGANRGETMQLTLYQINADGMVVRQSKV